MMKKSFLYLAVLIQLISCSKTADNDIILVKPSDADERVSEEMSSVPSSTIVKLDEATAELARRDIDFVRGQFGAVKMTRLFPDAGRFEERTRKEGLDRWYVVEYGDGVSQTKAMDASRSVEGVEYCEEPMPIKLTSTPSFNDPKLPQQWHYFNAGSAGTVKGFDVNVKPVWDYYTTGSSDVIVAVVDGGVDLTHLDLADNTMKVESKSFMSSFPLQPHSHGTHVAGTIAAVNNNKIGVSGLAGGDFAKGVKGVRIMSCQIIALDSDGKEHGDGSSANAIKYAADHGAVICNNSWGYGYKTNEDAKKGNISQADREAIEYFNKYAGIDENGVQVGPMAGGLVIFAAGNESFDYAWPSMYEGVMAVGSFDAAGRQAPYSNYGSWVDIAAPGGSQENQMVLSTVPGGYREMQGTSMACPHVSGVAALLVSYFGGPGFTREMLWEKLIGGADTGMLSSYSKIGPKIDALGSFTYGDTDAPAVISEPEISASSNTVSVTMSVPVFKGDIPAYGTLILYGTDKDAVAKATPESNGEVMQKYILNDAPVGASLVQKLDRLEFDREYYLKAYSYSYQKVYSDATEVYSVKTEVNNAPVIINDLPSTIQLRPFDKVTYTFRVNDPDGHAYAVRYERGSEADEMRATGGSYIVEIMPRNVAPGNYSAKFIAEDEFGAKSVCEINYQILPNTPPSLGKQIENIVLDVNGEDCFIDLDSYFTDADGEALKYVVDYTPAGVIKVNVVKNKMDISTITSGLVEVTVTASDAKNEKAKCTFKVFSKDSSVQASAYPNPARDFVNIWTADEGDYQIKVVSKNGSTKYEASGKIGPFEPVRLDVSKFAAGSYTAIISGSGKTIKVPFVKI